MENIRKRKFNKKFKSEFNHPPSNWQESFKINLYSYGDGRNVQQTGLLIVISIGIFFIGSFYVNAIHENERSFSQLGDLEREISFRSEMGFYYYFYKRLIESKTLMEGFKKLVHENFTEYPDTIIAPGRFNILPEILIGMLYRAMKYFNLISKECYLYKRDDGFTYDSCVGLEEPIFFYLQFAWYSAGLTTVFVFLFGLYLSHSPYGGLLSLLCFYFNHIECTRVQWTPPLRETFTYPLILLQMLVVSITLNKNSRLNFFRDLLKNESEATDKKFQFKFTTGLIFQCAILTSLCCLTLSFWQFSQFMLCTQFAIIVTLFLLRQITFCFMLLFSICEMLGILMAFVFLLFNLNLMTSIFSFLVYSTVIILMISSWRNVDMKGTTLMFVGGLPINFMIFKRNIDNEDNNHIYNLLISKLTNYKDFHTLIYTCSPEFDNLTIDALVSISYTGLLPLTLLIVFCIIFSWISSMNPKKLFGDIETHIVYNLLQTAVFCGMAYLFMRLKLFMNPNLCILASLFTSKYMPNVICRNKIFLFIALIGIMSYQGITNITNEHSKSGTFSYPPLEELLNYVNKDLPPNGVIAAPMATSSAVLLSTQRPIIIHPHYEHTKIRARTKDIYTIFSRKNENEVHKKLVALKANYVIIDYYWCFSKSQVGCLITELWDIEDFKNLRKKSFCSKAFQGELSTSKFQLVYQNYVFKLFKIL